MKRGRSGIKGTTTEEEEFGLKRRRERYSSYKIRRKAAPLWHNGVRRFPRGVGGAGREIILNRSYKVK